jgi:hypothetical protein
VNVVDVVEVDLVLVVVEKDVAVVPDQQMEKCVVMPNSQNSRTAERKRPKAPDKQNQCQNSFRQIVEYVVGGMATEMTEKHES